MADDFLQRQADLQRRINEARNRELEEYDRTLRKVISDEKELNRLYNERKQVLTSTYNTTSQIAMNALKENEYAKGSLLYKRQILEVKQEELRASIKQNASEIEILRAEQNKLQSKKQQLAVDLKSSELTNSDKYRIKQQLASVEEQMQEVSVKLTAAQTTGGYLQNQKQTLATTSANVTNEINTGTNYSAWSARKEIARENYEKARNDLYVAQVTGTAEQLKKATEAFNQAKEEYVQATKFSLKNAEGMYARPEGEVKDKDPKKTFEKILESVNKIHKSLTKAVDSAAATNAQYAGKITSRLQNIDDTGTTYTEIAQDVNDKLAVSPYVDSTKYLSQIAEFANAGINYNLEQRALVQTLSDKLVSTFDALDKNLTRLIRLQQTDMTYTQLGAEAQLTQFLNTYYSDTSYLSDMYDTVSSTLIEATSQMSAEDATAFSYNVQKWLAALYSVGLSDSAVTTIASGINLLSTGNVSELSNNSTLQTLLALSAQGAGLSYADLLTSGMNADNVDALMQSMVEYLQSIAENTGDQVTKSEFAKVLGLGVSDFRAISNLTSTDISTLVNSGTTYANAYQEYLNQMESVSDRTTVTEQLDNIVSNITYAFGNAVADNPLQYITWKLSDVINEMNTSGEDNSSWISSLLKAVGGGMSAVTGIIALVETAGSVINSISANGGIFTDEGLGELFGIDKILERGEGFVGIKGVTNTTTDELLEAANSGFIGGGTVTSGISYSSKVDNVATSAAEKALAYYDQMDENTTLSSVTITDASTGVTRSVSDIYAQLFDNQKAINVQINGVSSMALEQLESVHTGDEGAFTKMIQKLEDVEEVGKQNDTDISNLYYSIYNMKGV